MSKLQQGSRDELEAIRLKAMSHFAPILLEDALVRLCRACGGDSLDRFETAMLAAIERSRGEDRDFDDMKEFATEYLHGCLKAARSAPDMTASPEPMQARRTPGRSEKPETLEAQLQEGLEDSFPASDPPSVVSTTISGRAKKLTGTDEILERQRKG